MKHAYLIWSDSFPKKLIYTSKTSPEFKLTRRLKEGIALNPKGFPDNELDIF